MRLHVGTSGFSYKQWKGSFYPEKLPAKDMLAFYATKLSSVEINNTFYRMPNPSMLAGWSEAVSDGFVFVLKAPQGITHRARLKDVGESVELLWQASEALGSRRGPFLFQMPPSFRKDLSRLEDFLAVLPPGCRAALEFRHASWRDDAVLQALRDARAALCVADTDEQPAPAIEATADWGYLRLRRSEYDAAQRATWAERVAQQPWNEAFVFFKHEDEAPRMAQEFAGL